MYIYINIYSPSNIYSPAIRFTQNNFSQRWCRCVRTKRTSTRWDDPTSHLISTNERNQSSQASSMVDGIWDDLKPVSVFYPLSHWPNLLDPRDFIEEMGGGIVFSLKWWLVRVFDEFHTKKDQSDEYHILKWNMFINHASCWWVYNQPVCYSETCVNPYKYASQVDGGGVPFSSKIRGWSILNMPGGGVSHLS